MSAVETRTVTRDSLFLLASIRVEQDEEAHKVRVRNLSDGGMMGEGNLRVKRGNRLQIELRNIGKVEGSVAWVQDNRFGIAFDEEVESQLARKPSGEASSLTERKSENSWAHRAPPAPTPQSLRKV
ncbi:PilZ domain-containing protein [Erythrobacter crassostreae]|uniref:PilZ domain-containing protein n=1 Tax=Erythrobacter crassostreae TaxID=2828328 RepID=A0A9X1F1N5_9SPHN|nr:PilZ domain-containing protein [Erythrobacter crassostrea]MBV7258381.1 PilZ domain-containing protein [Erythrobacter crassostrea]